MSTPAEEGTKVPTPQSVKQYVDDATRADARRHQALREDALTGTSWSLPAPCRHCGLSTYRITASGYPECTRLDCKGRLLDADSALDRWLTNASFVLVAFTVAYIGWHLFRAVLAGSLT